MRRSASRRRAGRPLSVRSRILTVVLITTALGMTIAGGASYLIDRTNAHESIRNNLLKEVDEIHTVADLVRDGQAGRTVSGPEDVLYLAIRSSIPDPGEAVLGIVDGQVVLVPAQDVPSQRSIEGDPELIAAAVAVGTEPVVRIHQISTRQHRDLAFVSVPVQVTGSDQLGHFVAAVDVTDVMRPITRSHLGYAGISLLALIVIGLVAHQVSGRLLSPLRALRATAQRISEADLSDRIPAEQLASQDEVADLGRTVNDMLDRLAASFDTQRRLLDDAGHELRTPITIVRGHLELMDAEDPVEVREAREIAFEELDRMQRLVEDLLVLAKSRRPDFVQPREVLPGELLTRVLDTVSGLGEREWRLEGDDDLDRAGPVLLDPQRITQALVQLVANALRFTEPGSLLALGADRTADTLRVWVRDEGAGIPTEDQQRIFDRFARGEDQAGQDGSGLGLAIVSAIAEAHHGRVELVSTPGAGATFTLQLPLQPPSHPENLEEKQWHRS